MQQSYWRQSRRARISRRRAVTLTVGAGLGAVALAACGSSGSSGDKTNRSNLVIKPVDTAKQAKRGGTLIVPAAADTPNFDLYVPNAALATLQNPVSAHLLQYKAGHLEPSSYDISPDIAESFEFSADGLQLNLKLRQGIKWHNLPPVNGRAIDAEDITKSWDRFTKLGSYRSDVANAVNPNAPILSMESSDPQTIVVKLKEPISYLPAILAASTGGTVQMLPKEADSSWNFRAGLIGAGPYMLTDYKPSQSFTFKRNTTYYVQDHPYIDTIERPIISEYASAIAQLKAGNLLTYATGATEQVRQEDVVALKRETPDFNLYALDMTSIGIRTIFGWLPAGQSVFRDERMRQAYSMSWDRDLFIDTFYNVSAFTKQGLPVQTAWNTVIRPDQYPNVYLSPQSNDFGPNAQYYKYDVANAKKLVAAAGYPDGLDQKSWTANTTTFGSSFLNQVEVLESWSKDIGLRLTKTLLEYNQANYFSKVRDAIGKFEGVGYRLGAPTPGSDPVVDLISEYYSKGGGPTWLGFDVNGTDDGSGDPALDSQLQAAKREFDAKKRTAIVQDVQRYLGKAMYSVRWPGGASGFTLAWPALSNYYVFRGDNRQGWYDWWIDETKAPLKKS